MPVIDSDITRFQVRPAHKDWGEPGPDLLRTTASARRALAALCDGKPSRMWVKVGDRDWRKVGSKAAVLDAFERFAATEAREFRVGLQRLVRVEAFAVVAHRDIPYVRLTNCSPGTSLLWSLMRYAWPKGRFAGGYVWKQVKGSASWSDHAWGTAFDISQADGAPNDKMTDWLARMARAGLARFDYALGSRDGEVVNVSSDGDVRLSSASTSHLWHVHVSVIDHDGHKPPRTGGVF